MAASRFVQVTDEEIHSFKENNNLCNYTKTIIIIHLRLGE